MQDGYTKQEPFDAEDKENQNVNNIEKIKTNPSKPNSRPQSKQVLRNNQSKQSNMQLVKVPSDDQLDKMSESSEDYKYNTALQQVDSVMESNVQSKGMIKYQKAKIGALEEEMETLVEKMKALESENWELKKINKNLMKDTKKEKVQAHTLNSKVEKMKEQQGSIQDK